MPAVLRKSFSALSTASGTTLAVDSGAGTVEVDDLLVIGFAKSTSGDGNQGINTITDPHGNPYNEEIAWSQRASTVEVTHSDVEVTSQLAAGDDVTITATASVTRKLGIGLAFSGVDPAFDARSNSVVGTLTAGNYGFSGAASPVSMNLTATVEVLVVVFVAASSAANVLTPNAGQSWTAGPVLNTAAGSAERNLFSFYKTATAGEVLFDGTLLGGSWAGTMVAYPIHVEPPPSATGMKVTVGGEEKAILSVGVGVGGVLKNVLSTNVKVSGALKSIP